MKVPLKHINSNPRIVRCNDNTIYHFMPANGISLCYVDEKHVDELLLLKGGCCGNRHLLFSRASEAVIARYEKVQ